MPNLIAGCQGACRKGGQAALASYAGRRLQRTFRQVPPERSAARVESTANVSGHDAVALGATSRFDLSYQEVATRSRSGSIFSSWRGGSSGMKMRCYSRIMAVMDETGELLPVDVLFHACSTTHARCIEGVVSSDQEGGRRRLQSARCKSLRP